MTIILPSKIFNKISSGKTIVLTSEMFHDDFAKDKGSTQHPNSQKCADSLAIHLKAKNKEVIVFSFSEFKPEEQENLDGFILKEKNYPQEVENTIRNYL
jgi:hypothetical protein